MRVNQIENGLDLTKDAQNIEAIYDTSRYDVVYIPKLAPHSLFNSGNVPLRFITLSVKVKG